MTSFKRNILLALGLLLGSVVIASIVYPNSFLGYRSLFIDRQSHSYRMGETFEYSFYEISASADLVSQKPHLNDCSTLLENGIFNPDSKNAPIGQNWWPKEDCEAANQEILAKGSGKVNITLSYRVKNTSGEKRTLQKGWLKLVDISGEQRISLDKELSIAPHSTIEDSIEYEKSSTVKVGHIEVTLPDKAPQIINK